jgi:triosephosphate isomerase (TIM)
MPSLCFSLQPCSDTTRQVRKKDVFMPPRKLIAGNWKMNCPAGSAEYVNTVAALVPSSSCDVLVCPPATYIAGLSGRGVALGGQDCHKSSSGAHTGDISAEMLAEAGATAVIIGHSERRADHDETDADVAAKCKAAWRAGLLAIVCVGETKLQREAGETLSVVGEQVANSVPDGASPENLVIAYEPVWAIGTGQIPSPSDIVEAHAFLRDKLALRMGQEAESVRLLYGGSVKPSNAASILSIANVDGALVGGASLALEDFSQIITAADQVSPSIT